MAGYIKLYRVLKKNPIYKDAETLGLWAYLLLEAAWTTEERVFNNKRLLLLPGQLITGRKKLSEVLSMNEHKIDRTLRKLEAEKQITMITKNKYRILTISNWDKYQNSNPLIEQQNEQQNEQDFEQQTETGELHQESDTGFSNPLIEQQNEQQNEQDFEHSIKNKERSIKENTNTYSEKKESDIEEKKESKKKYGIHTNVLLKEDEYQKLIVKLGEHKAYLMIDELSWYRKTHKESYTSHYFTILNWARKDAKDKKNNNTRISNFSEKSFILENGKVILKAKEPGAYKQVGIKDGKPVYEKLNGGDK